MKKIVLIDPQPHTKETLISLSEKYEVSATQSYLKGLELLAHRPDLIILATPDPSYSNDTFHAIISHAHLNHIPLLLLSSLSQLIHPDNKSLFQTYDYLVKPIVESDLTLRIAKRLEDPSSRSVIIIEENESRATDIKYVLERHGIKSTITSIEHIEQDAKERRPNLIIANAQQALEKGASYFKKAVKDHTPSTLFLIQPDHISTFETHLLHHSDDFILLPYRNEELIHRVLSYLPDLPLTPLATIGSDSVTSDLFKTVLNKSGFEPVIYTLSEIFSSTESAQAIQKSLLASPCIIFELSDANPATVQNCLNTLPPRPILFLLSPEQLNNASLMATIKGHDFALKPLNEASFTLRLKKITRQKAHYSPATPENIAQDIPTLSENPTHKTVLSGVPRIFSTQKPTFIRNTNIKTAPSEQIDQNILHEPLKIHATSCKEFIDQLQVTLNHEIRNPLTSILIGAQALKHELPYQSEGRKFIIRIKNAAKRIKKVLDDLGNMQQVVTDDYMGNIKMLNLDKSSKGSSSSHD